MSLSAYLLSANRKEMIFLGKVLFDGTLDNAQGFWRAGADEDTLRRAIEMFLARHIRDGVRLMTDGEVDRMDDLDEYWHVDYSYGLPSAIRSTKKYRIVDTTIIEADE